MKSEEGGGGFVAGFLLGGLVGAALALLVTPRKGEETRDTLVEKGIELKVRAEGAASKARVEADDLLTRGRIVLEEQKGRVQAAIEEGKEVAAQKKAELLARYQVAKAAGEAPVEEPSLPEQKPEP